MKYPYLNDKEFLKRFDNETHKIQYTRIEVLDFHTENIIASIEGKSTGGSINLSGTSNMRRAGSCSLLVDPEGIKCLDIVENTNNIIILLKFKILLV
jgi:hypothetical protein